MDRIAAAEELFRKGCACSQAILTVYGVPLGLAGDQAMRLAAGFAAGMKQAQTCGAVAGAFMVLGLRHAPMPCDTPSLRADVYTRVQAFAALFRERNGSILCRELLGCDVNTPEGRKTAQEKNLFQTTCASLVCSAAEILETME